MTPEESRDYLHIINLQLLEAIIEIASNQGGIAERSRNASRKMDGVALFDGGDAELMIYVSGLQRVARKLTVISDEFAAKIGFAGVVDEDPEDQDSTL